MSEANDSIAGALERLDIYGLHNRHPGMAKEIADNFAVNAAICMSRHHLPPYSWRVRLDQHDTREYLVHWNLPTNTQLRSCANDDDMTMKHACVLAFRKRPGKLVRVAPCTLPSSRSWGSGRLPFCFGR